MGGRLGPVGLHGRPPLLLRGAQAERLGAGQGRPAYPGAQRYLRTGTRRFPIGSTYRIRIHQAGNHVDVDGTRLTSYTDRQRPYGAGTIGLYTEDATVQFDRLRVTAP